MTALLMFGAVLILVVLGLLGLYVLGKGPGSRSPSPDCVRVDMRRRQARRNSARNGADTSRGDGLPTHRPAAAPGSLIGGPAERSSPRAKNYRRWRAAMTARCSVRGTAWTLTVGLALAGALSFRGGAADASTRDSIHCPRPSQLQAGFRSEAIRAARKGLPSTFELREATRVGALPGHQDRYFLGGAAASSLTWLVDLHPPGMRSMR